MCRTTHLGWSYLFTGAGLQPVYPVRPPAAIVVFGALKPLLSALHPLIVRPIAFAFSGWIDDAGNVATATQGKVCLAAGELGDAPGRLPGHDMVLLCANSVDILANLAEINGYTLQDDLVGLDQIVLQVGIAQVERVGCRGHTSSIDVSVDQIEGLRLLAQQIVDHHVTPDQIIGA